MINDVNNLLLRRGVPLQRQDPNNFMYVCMNESNTKKKTLLKMWNERQSLIRNNQENAET